MPGDSNRLTTKYPTRVPGPSCETGFGGDCCCLWGHGSLCGHCCQELTASLSSYRILVPSPLWTRRSPNFTPSKMEERARSGERCTGSLRDSGSTGWGLLCKDVVAGGSHPGNQLPTERKPCPRKQQQSPLKGPSMGWARHPCQDAWWSAG